MNYTMTVSPGLKYTEEFRWGVQWYMMETQVFILTFSFKIKNENRTSVAFNGQSITFKSSNKEV